MMAQQRITFLGEKAFSPTEMVMFTQEKLSMTQRVDLAIGNSQEMITVIALHLLGVL